MTTSQRLAPFLLLLRIARAASAALYRTSRAPHPRLETRAVAKARPTAVGVRVALALLIAAVVAVVNLELPRPTEAQSTTTLVSNFSQSQSRDVEIDNLQYAIGIRTGDHVHGYRLDDVKLRFTHVTFDLFSSLNVELWDNGWLTRNDDPSMYIPRPINKLFAFENNNPTTTNADVARTFEAPDANGYRLEPRSVYWVVVRKEGSVKYRVQATNSDSEPGNAGNFHIWDDIRTRNRTDTGNWASSSYSNFQFKIDVNGAEYTSSDRLLSNLTYLDTNTTRAIDDRDYAIGFNTGNDPEGFDIDSVSFHYALGTTQEREALGVSLWTSRDVSGTPRPGYKLFDFNRGTNTTYPGLNTFNIPNDASFPGLRPDTRYFIVVREQLDVQYSVGLNGVRLLSTNSNSQNTAGSTWSLDDSVIHRAKFDSDAWPNDSSKVQSENWQLRVRIDGESRSDPVADSSLVSNLAQPYCCHATVSTDILSTLPSELGFALAQGFITGGHRPGYDLSHVVIDFESERVNHAQLEVSLWETGGSPGNRYPGTRLFAFTNPRRETNANVFEKGLTFFKAPAGTRIDAQKTYFVVIEKVDNNALPAKVAVTTSNKEDRGAAAGFTLYDHRIVRQPRATTDWSSATGVSTNDNSVMIDLRGEPAPYLVSNFGESDDGDTSTSGALVQGFRTGSNADGYDIDAVVVSFDRAYTDVVEMELWDSYYNSVASAERPDSRVFTFTSPSSLVQGDNAFIAPAGSTLEPNKRYYVHLRPASASSGKFYIDRTTSNDQEGLTGWTLHDRWLGRDGSATGQWPANPRESTDSALQLGIAGVERDQPIAMPTVSFERATYSVTESGGVTVKVQLSEDPERTVTIPLTTTNQGGATSADYSGVPASVTFQSGDTEKSFTFTADDDTDDDDDESVKLGFGTLPSNVTAGTTSETTISIRDNDDPAVTVTFDLADYSVAEGDTVAVKVKLNVNPERTVTIPLTKTNQSGATSADYSGVPASVTFQSGDTEKSFTFTAAQDAVDDDGESVKLGFGALPARVTAGARNEATVSIADNDDPAITVRFEQASYTVAEGGSFTVKVQLNMNPERTVTIPLTTTNRGGASSSDYSGVPASVTFQSGETEQSFTFTATQDTVDDDDESVRLGFSTLPAKVTAGTTRRATVSIADDDDPAVTVRFELADYTVAEGDNVAVKVKLNKNPERTVTIPLTTINQNGASSGDYSGVPSSVTFQSGETVRSFTFTAARDSVEDDGESVKLGFGTLPAKVTSGATDEATVSITDVAPVVNQPPTVSATAEPNTVYPGGNVVLRGMGSDPDGDALIFSWTSDGGGIFAPTAFLPQTAWIAPATETAHTVNLTLTVTDTDGLSASVTVSVLLEPFPQPNAATDLEANVQEDNTIHLSWTIPSQPSGVTIASVEAQRRMSGGAFSPPSWDTVVTLPASATFTGVPGLAADTEYVFRVRLTTTHGLFADSRYIRVRTLTGAPAPRHFAASGPTQTSITLNWFTVETAAAYKLEYRKDGETEWNRISGDFDHLPSTTDHRDALGVAAGLDCNTRYDFRLSARGSGETRNDGNRYPSTHFGSYATTSAQTGECAQEERVTNLLVSVEPSCAILTWTPPSGDRDTGYRVERYSHTGRAVGELQRTPLETLVEEPNRVANRYEDCSAEYRTDGAEHFYSVTALDNNPGPDEEGAFGTAYTSMLRYGTSREPEGPLNVRLTHDTQSSRGLAWDAPRDPWLTTVKTARAGSGPQQVVTDPWTTGYRVERREYRRTEGGGWFLPEVEDEHIWSATMTVGSSSSGTPATGYFPTRQ